jgi:hypothetical protein
MLCKIRFSKSRVRSQLSNIELNPIALLDCAVKLENGSNNPAYTMSGHGWTVRFSLVWNTLLTKALFTNAKFWAYRL